MRVAGKGVDHRFQCRVSFFLHGLYGCRRASVRFDLPDLCCHPLDKGCQFLGAFPDGPLCISCDRIEQCVNPFSRVTGKGAVDSQTPIYNEFTTIFTYIAGVAVIFTVVKLAIESATVVPEFLVYHKFAHAFGEWRGLHVEVLVGLFLPFVLLLIPSVRKSAGGKIVTSALILIGTLMMHMEILLAGQSHPVGPKAEQYPEFMSYFPSIWEWLVFVLALAVMLLLYTLGERYLKLAEAPQ